VGKKVFFFQQLCLEFTKRRPDLRGLSNNNRPDLTIQTIKSDSLRWPNDVTQGGKILLLNRRPHGRKKRNKNKSPKMQNNETGQVMECVPIISLPRRDLGACARDSSSDGPRRRRKNGQLLFSTLRSNRRPRKRLDSTATDNNTCRERAKYFFQSASAQTQQLIYTL
jgi:hypothetical protein